MFPKLSQWPALALAFAVSLAISYFMTPPVKRFAEKIGAMDIPKDDRRVHDHPIPRMGGLAIIMGFVLSVLLFVPVSDKVYGIVIGSFLIAGMGFVDDIVSLRPMVKFIIQIFAALVCVRFGLEIDAISWPSAQTYIELGPWGAPLTMLWIVLCTNAINLIDGLDGLAVGVSAICSFFLLMGALMFAMPTPAVALILAALLAACLGFISCWRRCPSWACLNYRPWSPLPSPWRIPPLPSSAALSTGRAPSRRTRATSTTGSWPWG